MINDGDKKLEGLKVPLARPWFTREESEVAKKVVDSGWLIFGPKTEELERKFARMLGAKHAIAVNSGSSALLVAQQALGLGKDDEVIVPNMTFVSTATSSMYLGARPVFVDITLDSYNIDPDRIEAKITKKTKGIIPVHFAGQTADMDKILKIARKYNLFVLEDAAEAHLADYKGKKAGTIGDIGIFSFTPTKPMITGEGGMIVTNSGKLAEKCRLIKNFGDTGKFRWDFLGFNFRMPEVMGAIGLVQLKKLRQSVAIRRKIASHYNKAFRETEGLIIPWVRSPKDINYQLYTLRLDPKVIKISNRDFIKYLITEGVSARIYYPPLHSQKVFNGVLKQKDSEFPNTLHYAKAAFCLPIFPAMTKEEIDYTIEVVKKGIAKFRN